MRVIVTSLVLVLSAGAALAQVGAIKPAPAASAKPATPAEAARAAKVAAAEVIAECMRLWDKGTHMSKQEWANTCQRIQTRLENLNIENLDVMGTGARKKAAPGKQGSVNSPSRTN